MFLTVGNHRAVILWCLSLTQNSYYAEAVATRSVLICAIQDSLLRSKFYLTCTIYTCPTLLEYSPGRVALERHGRDRYAEILYPLCYCLSPRLPPFEFGHLFPELGESYIGRC